MGNLFTEYVGSSSITLSSNLNSLHLHEVAGGVVDAIVVGLHRHPPKIVRCGNKRMKTDSKPIKGEGCGMDMFLFSCLRIATRTHVKLKA